MMRGLAGVVSSPIWNFAPISLISLSAVLILATHLGWVGRPSELAARAAPPAAIPAAPSPTAGITLRFWGDARAPERLSFGNIFRWYYLKNIMVVTNAKTRKEEQKAMGTLFLTFDKPVAINTVEVSSPDMRLPYYEVKDFNPRSAVIVFMEDLPPGTLVVSVHP